MGSFSRSMHRLAQKAMTASDFSCVLPALRASAASSAFCLPLLAGCFLLTAAFPPLAPATAAAAFSLRAAFQSCWPEPEPGAAVDVAEAEDTLGFLSVVEVCTTMISGSIVLPVEPVRLAE